MSNFEALLDAKIDVIDAAERGAIYQAADGGWRVS